MSFCTQAKNIRGPHACDQENLLDHTDSIDYLTYITIAPAFLCTCPFNTTQMIEAVVTELLKPAN